MGLMQPCISIVEVYDDMMLYNSIIPIQLTHPQTGIMKNINNQMLKTHLREAYTKTGSTFFLLQRSVFAAG